MVQINADNKKNKKSAVSRILWAFHYFNLPAVLKLFSFFLGPNTQVKCINSYRVLIVLAIFIWPVAYGR